MRLEKIKLAGFKSFVDPTTLHFETNLTSIVGPNGCGKSNIIDAMRWVTGESSAKQLRGASMEDVIFNGTTSRKPVGKASVELIFDNTEGRVGGEYANYNQISIRREVTRDGQSTYFLNGTRCRRKDILDILLGTGLGPRSYAVIEQGMISRLIEAKPEDMRSHIEEASGIAKYKERRRETENRIRHTRENLDRLNDLRDELSKQLAHLKRQANAAERYKVLKEEHRLTSAQLEALHFQTLEHAMKTYTDDIAALETQLESAVANQRHTDTQLEKLRQNHTEHTDKVNDVQAKYFHFGADIAKCEQKLNSTKDRQHQLQEDADQVTLNIEELEEQREQDASELESVQSDLNQLEPELDSKKTAADDAQAKRSAAEEAMQTWQRNWDNFNEENANTNQLVQMEQMRIQHLEEQIEKAEMRLLKLGEEINSLSDAHLDKERVELETQKAEAQSHLDKAENDTARMKELIEQQRENIKSLQGEFDNAREQLQQARAEKTSLEALQQAALSEGNEQVDSWLEDLGLDTANRLVKGVRVEAGWERAIETVMGPYLEAVCVDDSDFSTEQFARIKEGSVTLYNTSLEAPDVTIPDNSLAHKVESSWPVAHLLKDILVADSFEDAMPMLSQLAAHQSIVTPEGYWLSTHWIRINKASDAKAGMLKREQRLTEINDEIAQHHLKTTEFERQIDEAKNELADYDIQFDIFRRQVNEYSRKVSDFSGQLSALDTRYQQFKEREANVNSEMKELEQQSTKAKEDLLQARRNWEAALEKAKEAADKRIHLEEERRTRQSELHEARESANVTQQALNELQIKLESSKGQVHYLEQAIERSEKQMQASKERLEAIKTSLVDFTNPLPELQKELDALLEQRLEVEQQLQQARAELQACEQNMREEEQKRSGHDEHALKIREQLESKRVQQQTMHVKRDTHQEHIAKLGYDLEEILPQLTDEMNPTEWETQVEKIQNKIARLGPINLAAIDEHEQLTERKTYLDKQNDDLIEALDTLEGAIKKIDHDTRTRFKETFDKVNEHFQQIFPKIFGGGKAYLELTDDDILNTGIMVKAQPPGKKNTTIHLLSGGEKALTAISLVFSMFQLNPAPFCVLDEVDAPLDDVNVGRYCDLVKEMSDKVQFIFISHNKITIAMAKQLAGVTMHEAGVSRLVSVDIEKAISMAEA